jgi:Uma2 family endonuclease
MATPAMHVPTEQEQDERPVTFEEYRALPDDGPRYQLINGELFMSPAPKLLHQYVIGEFFAAINDHVRRHRLGLAMFAPYDVKLTGHTAVQPDLLFFSTANQRAMGDDYATGAPDLAIEVLSPSNRRIDLVLKRAIYADNGVAEYWIVDPSKRTVRVNLLHDGRYVETTHTGGMVEFATLPGLAIDMAALFDMPEWILANNDEDDSKE